jgi:alpha-mannosidase
VLREAWRILMQCHPHDSICGCSIDQVHEEMRPRFDQVEQIGEVIVAQSLEALAGVVATQASGSLDPSQISSAVVVFNPSAAVRNDLVSTELKVLPENGEFELVDEKGEAVPFQKAGMGSGVLYNMRMDRNEFRVAVEMISPGTGPEGMRFLEMKVVHEDAQPQIDRPKEVQVELRVSSVGDPDLKAWNRSRQELAELLENPAIENYHILVRGNPTSQVRIAARDVPGLGYRAYWVRGKTRVEQEPAQMNPLVRALMPLATRLAGNPAVQRLIHSLVPDPATRPPYKIENEFFTVEARPNGSVDVLDKYSGVMYRGQNRFVDGGDRGDTYNYSKPEVDPAATVWLKGAQVEHGTIQQTMELRLEMDVPEKLSADRKARSPKKIPLVLTSRVTLSVGVERVEFHTEVDNSARDHRLRVHFAAQCTASAVDYDGHFEIVRRAPDLPAFDENWAEQPRPEVPQRAFTAISDGKNGLLVANRGLPEVEVLKRADGNSEVALTLLRCVGWLSRGDFPERKGPAGPVIETPAAQMIGHWSFDYALVPFVEAGRMQAIQQVNAFEASLRAVSTTLHEGTLPAQGSFIKTDSKEFIISAVKLSEDKRGMVVRGYNITGKPITVQLKVFLNFKTVIRVNLNEERLESLIPSANNEITLDVKAYEIVTVLFTFLE